MGLLDTGEKKKRGLFDSFSFSQSSTGNGDIPNPTSTSGSQGRNTDPTPTKSGFLGKGWDDPKTIANLRLAAGLMTPGSLGQGLGRGLAGYEDTMNSAARQNLAQQEVDQRGQALGSQMQMQQLQMQDMQRQAEQQIALQSLAQKYSLAPPHDGVGPQGFDFGGYSDALAAVDPVKALAMKAALQKDNKLIPVPEGTSMLDPQTREPVYTNPKAKDDPAAIKEFQLAQMQGFKGSFLDYQMALRKAGATNVSVSTGQKGLENEMKLRDDLRSEPVYKAFNEVKSAHAQIVQGLKLESPAGDLAAATKVMKILDPGSVVRESELGMAIAATGLADRVTSYATNILKGTKLTPAQRKDFRALADALYGESVKQYNGKRGEYESFAKDWGLNAGRVAGPAASGPAPAPAGALTPAEQAELDALRKRFGR